MSSSTTNATVLIVDDEPANITVLASALSDTYAVKVAGTGSEALRIVRHTAVPDLILLDVMLPDMTGFEVCQKLKDDSITSGIPVIFVTSLDDQINEEMGFKAGAVDYIYKPISPPIVRARAKVHIEHRLYSEALELLLSKRSAELERIKSETKGLAALLGKLRLA